MIVELQSQTQDLQNANEGLQKEAVEAKTMSEKALNERAEAATALIKLDEARVLLNKLLGPQGPLSMSERHKFLSQVSNTGIDATIDNTINDRSAPFYTNSATAINMQGNPLPQRSREMPAQQ